MPNLIVARAKRENLEDRTEDSCSGDGNNLPRIRDLSVGEFIANFGNESPCSEGEFIANLGNESPWLLKVCIFAATNLATNQIDLITQ